MHIMRITQFPSSKFARVSILGTSLCSAAHPHEYCGGRCVPEPCSDRVSDVMSTKKFQDDADLLLAELEELKALLGDDYQHVHEPVPPQTIVRSLNCRSMQK